LKLLIEEAFHLQCDQAYSAKEALKLIKDRLVEGQGVHRLILTDINMPEIDGLQMARMIKKQLNKLKIRGTSAGENSTSPFQQKELLRKSST
jgi:YesN/AraC family two-component response regulator